MDQPLELTDIKTEPLSEQQEILTDVQPNSVKQESNCLIHSEIHIKTEPQEDENAFPVIAGTSYDLCSYNDIKDEMEEPLIKMEYENMLDEMVQDPLDVGSERKAEVSTSKSCSETSNKPEQTGEEVEKYLLTFYDDSGISSNQEQLIVQYKKIHKDERHICHVCNKAFGKKCHLNTHLLIHSGRKPFMCKICKKTFTQKSDLTKHFLVHSVEKPYICDVCKKFFRGKSNLNKHKLIHSGLKQFLCHMCDKSFAQTSHLIRHKRIHTGEKPYICDLCKKAFTDKSALTRHRRLHTGETPYSCDICNKSFAQTTGLNQHKRVHKK